MLIEHEWPEQTEEGQERCIHCGTTRAFHNGSPQNCVPRWNPADAPRPTSTGQSAGDFAADDADTITARLKELEAERLAILNAPPTEETD